MSRQSSSHDQKVSCHNRIFLGRDRIWPRQKGFRVVTKYLYLDRVWPRPKGLVLRQSSLCHDRAWLRPRNFMSRHNFREWCCDRVFYVATQLALNRRLLVVIERFYVATEFGHARSFLSRQSWQWWRGFMSRLSIFMSRQSWLRKGEFLS